MKAVIKPLSKIKGRLLTAYDASFIIKAGRLWNILPGKITQITSMSSFKVELNKFLLTIPDKPPVPGYPHINSNSLIEQCL